MEPNDKIIRYLAERNENGLWDIVSQTFINGNGCRDRVTIKIVKSLKEADYYIREITEEKVFLGDYKVLPDGKLKKVEFYDIAKD